jgi:hypothetical protein
VHTKKAQKIWNKIRQALWRQWIYLWHGSLFGKITVECCLKYHTYRWNTSAASKRSERCWANIIHGYLFFVASALFWPTQQESKQLGSVHHNKQDMPTTSGSRNLKLKKCDIVCKVKAHPLAECWKDTREEICALLGYWVVVLYRRFGKNYRSHMYIHVIFKEDPPS